MSPGSGYHPPAKSYKTNATGSAGSFMVGTPFETLLIEFNERYTNNLFV